MEVLGIKSPFTKAEFLRASTQEQIEMAKVLMETVADAADAQAFDWRKKVDELKGDGEDSFVVTCHHEAVAIKTTLKAERELQTLRASMEDLCKEMDRVKEESERVFVMGPASSEEDVARGVILRLKDAGLLKTGVGTVCEDPDCELCYLRVAIPGYGGQ